MSIKDKEGNLHSEINGRFIPKKPNIQIHSIAAFEFNRKITAHHIRHAMEMGYTSMKDYERAAVNFFNGAGGKLYYSKARKRYYRYDEKTGEMAVFSDGLIHTYMKNTHKRFLKIIKQDKLEEISYERIGGLPYLRDEI